MSRKSGRGIDCLLAQYGTPLEPGQSVRFTLIKGRSGIVSSDPLHPNIVVASSSTKKMTATATTTTTTTTTSTSTKKSKQTKEEVFPLVAKFTESVVRPNFIRPPWNTDARLYQQDVPKVKDDSDDDDESETVKRKKKRRWKGGRRMDDEPKRQWMLQTNVDFLETMMVAKRHSAGAGRTKPSSSSSSDNVRHYQEYVGLPEHNGSYYAILSAGNNNCDGSSLATQDDDTTSDAQVHVSILPPPHATINFSQRPTSTRGAKTDNANANNHIISSLSQADQVISRRNAARQQQQQRGGGGRTKSSKGRLLDRLEGKGGNDDDDDVTVKMRREAMAADLAEDDVMADVAFIQGVGTNSTARRELLSDMMADEGGTVLGGTNDGVFGGRKQAFGRSRQQQQQEEELAKSLSSSSSSFAKGGKANDGMAMEDDFYKRDVVAEYEDLDYDANEQFEDDDVDMGEKEEHLNPNSGFADPDTDEDDEAYDDTEGGAEGLASLAGFKKLLAKARGEVTDEQQPQETTDDDEGKKDGGGSRGSSRPSSPTAAAAAATASKKEVTVSDPLANVIAGAEKAAKAAKEPPTKKQRKDTGVLLDKQGRRLLTQDGIQKEIWLNHGAIEAKRLMKTFGVKTKDRERYDEFIEIIRKICLFEKDEMGKPIFKLKQHYKKMG